MKGKNPESIALSFIWLESLTQDFTNEEIDQIIRDLYNHAKNGTDPPIYPDRGMRMLWALTKDGDL